MSAGAILIGMAALVLVVAYVMLPFRRSPADLDAVIERWVAEARKGEGQGDLEASDVAMASGDLRSATSPAAEQPAASQHPVAAYCHNCGKPVRPDHHFCPHCGTRLDEV